MISAVLALASSILTGGMVFFKVGGWQAQTEQRIKTLEESEKVRSSSFLTRGEWDQFNIGRDRQLKAIEDTAKRTESQVEKIYDILRTR